MDIDFEKYSTEELRAMLKAMVQQLSEEQAEEVLQELSEKNMSALINKESA